MNYPILFCVRATVAPLLVSGLLTLASSPAQAQISTKVGDWPQWRGVHRDGVSAEKGLLNAWPTNGPKLQWSTREVGIGHAGPVLVGDFLYSLGDLADGCYALTLERKTGKVVAKTRVGEAGGHSNYPGPRATPTIDGNLLIAETQHGDVVCVDLAAGKLLWSVNLLKDLNGTRPMWYFGESPLVDVNRVICTPGGPDGTLAALDKMTGKVLWRSAGFTDDCTYASVIPAEVGGVRHYVQMTVKRVAGVEATTGNVLWRADRAGERAIVPTPIFADGCVYVTSGYGVGSHLFKIGKSGDDFTASQVYASKIIANHHGGVIKVGDHLYGHSDTGGWTCQEFKTGKVLWQDRGIGKGSATYADGHLYCRCEDGPIALVEATPAGYREKGRFTQPDRSNKKAWAHPVVGNGQLYIRDQSLLLCYDVKGN
jgi:outer membrane protein assembly factor BamB